MVGNGTIWGYVSAAVAIGITVVVIGMAVAVLLALFNGTIDLKYLLAEPADPEAQKLAQASGAGAKQPPEVVKASLSRFQFLIFTFVIAGVYLVLCLESGVFVAIPENVVWLLGVSGGTYAASKGLKTLSDNRSKAAATDGDGDGSDGSDDPATSAKAAADNRAAAADHRAAAADNRAAAEAIKAAADTRAAAAPAGPPSS